MDKDRCIVCGTPHANKHLYCDDACAWLDIRHGLKALQKYQAADRREFTTSLGKALYGNEFEVLAENEGCVVADSYPYGEIAAENCANL